VYFLSIEIDIIFLLFSFFFKEMTYIFIFVLLYTVMTYKRYRYTKWIHLFPVFLYLQKHRY